MLVMKLIDIIKPRDGDGTKRIIVSDLDETLVFTDKSMLVASEDITGTKMSRGEIRKLPTNLKARIYDRAQEVYSDLLGLNHELLDAYKTMKSAGYELMVLTARPVHVFGPTENVLKNNGIPYDYLMLRAAMHISDREWKRRVLEDLSRKYDDVLFFDDREENLSAIAGINGGRIRCFKVSEKTLGAYP